MAWHDQRVGSLHRNWTAGIATCAMAAGIVVGLLVAASRDSAPIEAADGRFFARGELSRAISLQFASEEAIGDGVVTRIATTFRDRSGEVCRTFVTYAAEPFAGIACREGDEWRIALLAPADTSGANRSVPEILPKIVQDGIASRIAGATFTPAQERAALHQGWR